MKKLFLFVAAATLTLSLNSCSKDDGGSSTGGKVTVKIDGVSKTFDTTVVNEEVFTEDGVEYTQLEVTATIGTSTTELITFSMDKGDVGSGAIYSFIYTKNGETHYRQEFSTNVITNNSSKKLKGNFSGTMYGSGGSNITLTDGSFDIQY